MKKLLLLASLMVIGSHSLSAGTISFDQLSVSDDLSSTKYNSDLNRVYQMVNTNIQSGNIANDTLAEADMADEINPRIRTDEGASCNFVYSGFLPAVAGSLTTSTSAGTAYVSGYRIYSSSAASHTFTASKWTWVDLDPNGTLQYSEVAIGGATPALTSGYLRLARVSTDGTTVNTVTDLRTTSCVSGPFNKIADASGEADLGDILYYPGWQNGLSITTRDNTSVSISPGSIYINGEFRSFTATTTADITSAAGFTNNVSGLDTGSIAANTNYFIYAVADQDGVTPFSIGFSTSSSAPSGATNYRRIGEISSDASSNLVSSDVTSVSYLGKILQIKKKMFSDTASGTTAIPGDDTPPLITEGDRYMSLPFTPVSSTSILKVDVIWIGQSVGGTVTVALFQDSGPSALGAAMGGSATNDTQTVHFTTYVQSNSATTRTFYVHAGHNGGATVYFNGTSGGRFYGGAAASSITVTEYAR